MGRELPLASRLFRIRVEGNSALPEASPHDATQHVQTIGPDEHSPASHWQMVTTDPGAVSTDIFDDDGSGSVNR